MNTASIERKHTSFRLRTDLLEILKAKAAEANLTLNNYVESVLLDIAYNDEPNAETRAAIEEARAGKHDPSQVFDNVDDLMKSLMAE